MKISEKKFERLVKLSDDNKVIAALAIDQRGAMEKMVPNLEGEERTSFIKKYKSAVAKELTKYSSSILLDPIYGIEAIKDVDENAGLLMAYEITGYRDDNRQLELTPTLSARRIQELGADAVKVLLYYDVDDTDENNEPKKAEIERIGAECMALDIPFFLEILTYDNHHKDATSKEFAKLKPRKVNEAMKLFSDERYGVDVLKVEVPVNIKFVEGFGEEVAYTREEAARYFKEQSEITNLPYIFLSAGVSAELFQETLRFAKEAGAEFQGVLCGRATWKGGVAELEKGEEQCIKWLRTEGKQNIVSLNEVLKETCTPWTTRLEK
ncbi:MULTISPECIES: tagatose 1,6-diphosphate aldolase [Helcococcus]|uniref:Tagatose 1,6-diphosphate aldolase n=1 Tax=Helcococcus bovis TaxID=3153252 RepID=A0ABW9F890_9FIRM